MDQNISREQLETVNAEANSEREHKGGVLPLVEQARWDLG